MIPLAITAVISVFIGLYPSFFMRFVQHLHFMKLVKLIEFLRDRLKTVIRVCFAVLALLDPAWTPSWSNKEHAHTAARASARLLVRVRLSSAAC